MSALCLGDAMISETWNQYAVPASLEENTPRELLMDTYKRYSRSDPRSILASLIPGTQVPALCGSEKTGVKKQCSTPCLWQDGLEKARRGEMGGLVVKDAHKRQCVVVT